MPDTQDMKTIRAAAIAAARAAEDKKATDIMVQEVGSLIGISDYFVIASASNPRQVDAIIEAIEDVLRKDYDMKPASRELSKDGSWSLLDFGPIVVHVFQEDTREYYRLESLWTEAPVIDLSQEEGFGDLQYSERIAQILERAERSIES